MTVGGALAAVGLIRPARRVGGFCPACRRLPSATGDGTASEIAPPALIALVFLVVAAVAWVPVVEQSRSMGGMAMGLGSVESFAVSWVVMMAAMMLPTAVPLVFEFARDSEGRHAWQVATGMLGVTYLSVWLAFGVVCYAVRRAFPMPLPNQGLVGGLALVLAGLYALTPLKRASEARCRGACALHGPLPFNLTRSAVVAGARYGLSCIGCSAAVMVAMVIIGMSNLGWIVILGAVVLAYKLAPAPSARWTLALSAGLCLLGAAYWALT
jgi:predicted metal-binding membrane protein